MNLREDIARGNLRPMDEDEIEVLGHFLLGARHFLDQMMDGHASRPYPGDEAVVDTYLRLVRDGLRRRDDD